MADSLAWSQNRLFWWLLPLGASIFRLFVSFIRMLLSKLSVYTSSRSGCLYPVLWDNSLKGRRVHQRVPDKQGIHSPAYQLQRTVLFLYDRNIKGCLISLLTFHLLKQIGVFLDSASFFFFSFSEKQLVAVLMRKCCNLFRPPFRALDSSDLPAVGVPHSPVRFALWSEI